MSILLTMSRLTGIIIIIIIINEVLFIVTLSWIALQGLQSYRVNGNAKNNETILSAAG